MKSVFPGFYNPSEKALESAWKDDGTLFVFDTNTLLNLYGYAVQTRNDFFSILNAISEKIWIPYHVALEYQLRRLSVVRDEKAIFRKVEDLLSRIDKIFESDLKDLALSRRFPTLHENTEKLHSDIKKLISSYKRSLSHWDRKQPCVRAHDAIREKLDIVFEGKVGDPPDSQKSLDEIYKEGEKRFKNKVPPGYKDASKASKDNSRFVYSGLEYERQYGDLIVWKQLIEKSKQDDIKAVIFITDDAKEDWWYIINSRGEKSIGPRAELREEICKEGKIELFAMYNTSGFLDSGKKLLEVDIKEESISEAGENFDKKVKLHEIFESAMFHDLDKYNKSFKYVNQLQRALNKLQRHSALQQAIENENITKLKDSISKSYDHAFRDLLLNSNEFQKLIRPNRYTEIEELLNKYKSLDIDEEDEEP